MPSEPTSIVTVEDRRIVVSGRNKQPCEFTPGRDLWERQKGESRQAYTAFESYLAMPYDGEEREARSIRGLAARDGHHPTLYSRWSVRWRWVERVQEWDVHVDRLTRARLEDLAMEAARRKLQVARRMLVVVDNGLTDLSEGERKLGPMEVARLAEAGGRLAETSVGTRREDGERPKPVEGIIIGIAQREGSASVTD